MINIRNLTLGCSLIILGCNGNQNTSVVESNEKDTIVYSKDKITDEVRDIEIGLDIDYSDNKNVGGDCLKYKVNMGNDEFVVEPTAPYYNKYISGKRYEVPMEAFYGDNCYIDVNVYPKFYCYLQNNTTNPISISSLIIDVEKSSTDKFPYFRIATEKPIVTVWCFQTRAGTITAE